jgi:phospholipid/cholesterol/gamma-HCH transport system substrate-binding protein
METRVPHWNKLIAPAAFALTCVVLTIVALIVFGSTRPFAPQGYRVEIPLAQAANLVPGSDVEIAGVTVGNVIGISRAGNTARATIQLNPQFVPLRSGAIAIERTKTLLGEGYIELAPGPRAASPIPDGGTLRATQVRPAVQLDQFISTFDPSTRVRMRQLFAGLAGAFSTHEQSLNDAIGWYQPLSAHLQALLGTLQAQSTNLAQLISSSETVLSAVGHREGTLQAAVTAGNEVLGTTARESQGLAATIQAFPGFLTQLKATSDTITAASPALGAAVRALEPVAGVLAPTLHQIDVAAPEFRGLFRELPATLTTGRRALPALRSMIVAARGAFAQFYPTARNLIPFMQLFALNNKIVDILANVASLASGSFVGPEGKVVGTLNGVATIWNETISGWAHKLPTNRQEPYPAPGALLETGQIGVLKSYDCRNTGNPLWLPPIGLGAPPCILQGPWTFDGKTAYYPRLTLAPP